MTTQQVLPPPTAQRPPPPPPPQAPQPLAPTEYREAFLVNARVRTAKLVGSVTAVALTLGLIGGLATLHHKSIFDLASSFSKVYKPGFGYIFGPLLIFAAWPKLRKSQAIGYAYAKHYRARIVVATLLWVAGLVALIAGVSGLSAAYTVKTGTYVAATLLSIGLIATLAMWPRGLTKIHVTGDTVVPEQLPEGPTAPPAGL